MIVYLMYLLSPPSSSMAVEHGPCLLTLKKMDPGLRNQVLLRIFYFELKTNDWMRIKVKFLVGPQKPLLATVKRRKLA